MDRRHLSAVLSRTWRCLARWRSCSPGSREDRTWTEDAPDAQRDGAACRTMAPATRRRRAYLVELLQEVKKARGCHRQRGLNLQPFGSDRIRTMRLPGRIPPDQGHMLS